MRLKYHVGDAQDNNKQLALLNCGVLPSCQFTFLSKRRRSVATAKPHLLMGFAPAATLAKQLGLSQLSSFHPSPRSPSLPHLPFIVPCFGLRRPASLRELLAGQPKLDKVEDLPKRRTLLHVHPCWIYLLNPSLHPYLAIAFQ